MAFNPAEAPYPEGSVAKLVKFPLVLYRMGIGPLIADKVAILSTRGRRTGLLRHTPIGYARDGDIFYVASGWGEQADWYKNLQANPNAALQIGNWRFAVKAELLSEPEDLEAMLQAAKTSGNPVLAEYAGSMKSEDFASDAPDKPKGVRLMPTGYPPEGEIPKDLTWIWFVLALPFVIALLKKLLGGKKKPEPLKLKKKAEKVEKEKKEEKQKKEKEAPSKRKNLAALLKMAKAAPALIMLMRKLKDKEGEEFSGRDWLEIGTALVTVMRQATS